MVWVSSPISPRGKLAVFTVSILLLTCVREGAATLTTPAAPQLDGSLLNATTAAAIQEQFMATVQLADRVYEVTLDRKAAIAMLRAAFQLCPACPSTRQGAWRFEVVSIDDFEDRQMMYAKIMPALYGSQFQRVLWVGVHPYTLRYQYMFQKHGITMTSLEINPDQAPYGSTHRHVIAPVQQLAQYFEEGTFDAVIINGVIGWGVDTEKDVADTMAVLHGVLRDQGLLVVGYNKPISFHYWTGGLLPLFENATLGPLPHEVYLHATKFHHAYEFFTKADWKQHRTPSHGHYRSKQLRGDMEARSSPLLTVR